jgi:hypothetical protein
LVPQGVVGIVARGDVTVMLRLPDDGPWAKELSDNTAKWAKSTPN